MGRNLDFEGRIKKAKKIGLISKNAEMYRGIERTRKKNERPPYMYTNKELKQIISEYESELGDRKKILKNELPQEYPEPSEEQDKIGREYIKNIVKKMKDNNII